MDTMEVATTLPPHLSSICTNIITAMEAASMEIAKPLWPMELQSVLRFVFSRSSCSTAQDIRKGDQILSLDEHGESCVATVKCVVVTKCLHNEAKFIELPNGLLITSWHPIRIEGKWVFPATVEDKKFALRTRDYVFNFLLDSCHVAFINGVECICLAHGIEGDKVASHEYYGTQKVVEDLMQQPGWSDGRIELDPSQMARDEESGRIVGVERKLQ